VANPRRRHRVGSGGLDPHDIQHGFIRAEIISFAIWWRGRRDAGQTRRQTAFGTQDVRDAGLRRDELPVQQVSAALGIETPAFQSCVALRRRKEG